MISVHGVDADGDYQLAPGWRIFHDGAEDVVGNGDALLKFKNVID